VPRKAIRIAARLLLFPLIVPLVLTPGCAVIGYGVGSAIDTNAPDLDTLTVAAAQTRPAQTPVTVFLRDGGSRQGRLHAVIVRDPRTAHRALAELLPRTARLPLPGETLLVSVGTAKGPMVFERMALAGESHNIRGNAASVRDDAPVALFSMGSGAQPLAVSLDSTAGMIWPDGTKMSGSDLCRALRVTGLPNPRVLLLVNASGNVDSIPAWRIRGIEAARAKRGATRGALIGIIIDALVVWWLLSLYSCYTAGPCGPR
jgi:hypothetical protein